MTTAWIVAVVSGSAGIAAALARGVRSGVLAAEILDNAQVTWRGLQAHLCVDGMLDGGVQSNRGGEALQRGDYRVLTLLGTGLMGQLAAALGEGGRTMIPSSALAGADCPKWPGQQLHTPMCTKEYWKEICPQASVNLFTKFP